MSNYRTKGTKKKITRLSYNAIQGRMASIKRESSFAEKNLSIKNIRHTLIKKMLQEGKSVEFINNNIGIDISTLKIYLPEAKRNDTAFFLKEHPYLAVIS